MNTQQSTSLLAIICMIAYIPAAYSQDEVFEIEEIIVTAQKREQVLSEIGISAIAFSGAELRDHKIERVNDLSNLAANVNITSSFGEASFPAIVIRSVDTDTFESNSAQPTGTYVDGVYLSQPPLLAFQTFDLDRVEILKGPQGTLYGRNSTGGAVNFYSRRPTEETEGYFEVGFGKYDRFDFEGAVGSALSENVSARASLKVINQDEGPFENISTGKDEGGLEKTAARLQFLYTPSDDFEALLKIHGGVDKSDGWRYEHIPAFSPGTTTLCPEAIAGDRVGAQQNCVAFPGVTVDNDGDPFRGDWPWPSEFDNSAFGVLLNIEKSLDGMTLTSVTAYDDLDRSELFDGDASAPQFLDNVLRSDVKQYSQELRLSSDNDADYTWIVGAFYGYDEIIGNPASTFISPDFFAGDVLVEYVQETETAAAFAHFEKPLSDRWNAIIGARYTWIEGQFDATNRLTALGDPDTTFAVFASVQDVKVTDNDFSWKLGLEYSASDDTLMYGSISKGFRAAAFNGALSFSAEALEPTDAETLLAYEGGIKSTLLDRTLQVNAAVFFYDFQDIQITAIETRGSLLNSPFLTNADGADIYGAEVELQWRPADGLDIRLQAGYTKSELGDAMLEDLEGNIVNVNGMPLANSPELSFGAAVRYEGSLTSSTRFAVVADYSWNDEIARDLVGTKMLLSPSYSLLNAKASLIFGQDSDWELGVWAKNLTDEEYKLQSYQLGSFLGMFAQGWGAPRSYGVSLSKNF